MQLPDGFSPHTRRSPLTEPWEPLYARHLEDHVQLALEVRTCHCNSRGLVHGGLIASLVDNAMGLSCMTALRAAGASDISGLLTVSLHVDYLAGAKIGSWLVFETNQIKVGRTLSFAGAIVLADRDVVARASGVFRSAAGSSSEPMRGKATQGAKI